jgi:hypothetical protein
MHGNTLIVDHIEKVLTSGTYKDGRPEGEIKVVFEDGREKRHMFENGVEQINEED